MTPFPPTTLSLALSPDSDRMFNALTSLGVDRNATDKDGNTLLIRAVGGESPERIRRILGLGVDITRKNLAGRTARMEAERWSHHWYIVQILNDFERAQSAHQKTAVDASMLSRSATRPLRPNSEGQPFAADALRAAWPLSRGS